MTDIGLRFARAWLPPELRLVRTSWPARAVPASAAEETRPDAARDAGPRVFVFSRRNQGAEHTRQAHLRDEEAEPAPYGFNLAEATGWRIRYSEARRESFWSRKIFGALGFDLCHALDNLAEIRRADIVWTMLEWEWLGVALLQRLGLAPRRPVIANSVWLSERWRRYWPLKRALLKWLMLPHFEMTLHSERGLERLRTILPAVAWRVSRFGISTRAFPITPPRVQRRAGEPVRIYAIGNDFTRDWETLLQAFGGDPRFEVSIACGWLDPACRERHGNLRLPSVSTISRQREEYSRADIVVIPMTDNTYSGITVAMEAVAMGKPLVSSGRGSVDTYFGTDQVLGVAAGDPEALRQAVLATSDAEFLARAERAQAAFIANDYSAERMIGRYVADTRRVLRLDGAAAG